MPAVRILSPGRSFFCEDCSVTAEEHDHMAAGLSGGSQAGIGSKQEGFERKMEG